MSKLRFSKGRFSRFISSKGFYFALAVCLAGAGVATYMAVDRTINVIEQTAGNVSGQPQAPALPEQNRQDLPTAGPAPGTPLPSTPPAAGQEEEGEQALRPAEEPDPPGAEQPAPPPTAEQQPAPPAQATSPRLSYILPVVGDIVKPFSDGELVRNVTMGDWRTHDGIDIQAERGTEILAAADGVVSQVRVDPLWGAVVVIDHADGYQTHYSGLESNVPVSEGENVSARQSIGRLEGVPSEAQDERVHLHFAVMRDGQWIDPISLIG